MFSEFLTQPSYIASTEWLYKTYRSSHFTRSVRRHLMNANEA